MAAAAEGSRCKRGAASHPVRALEEATLDVYKGAARAV
jgi:hypothetical protein